MWQVIETVRGIGPEKYDVSSYGVKPRSRPSFAQFTEPVTATLADLRELTRSLSAFAAFQSHFLFTFAAISSL
jgi:hypothetical protein